MNQLALSKQATWQALADDDLQRVRENSWWHRQEMQIGTYSWGVPPQEVLDRAVQLRKRLDAQVAADLPSFKDKLLLVVGQASFTPDGYSLADEGLVYLDAPDEGDGRVTRRQCAAAGRANLAARLRARQPGRRQGSVRGLPRAARHRHHPSAAALRRDAGACAAPRPASPARVRSRPSRNRVAGPPPQTHARRARARKRGSRSRASRAAPHCRSR